MYCRQRARAAHLGHAAIVATLSTDTAAAPVQNESSPQPAKDQVVQAPELEDGFRLLYELKPAEAREKIQAWQQAHPEDPLGPALQAANYLLEECYRDGVLSSEYFLNDKPSKNPIKPDPAHRAAFVAAFQQSVDLARNRLKTAPSDVNALFAMTMTLGMQADYAGLIDKHQAESLGMMKDSAKYAQQLLAINPGVADAYLAVGASNYIVGSLSGTQRFFLGFKGIHGNLGEGLQQLEIAATRGHYLRPFAKMLLALANLHQKKPDAARTQFAELAQEFPSNPLFAAELAKLTGGPVTVRSEEKGP